jgi:hypothetical protein
LIVEEDEEESSENKFLDVNPSRNSVRKPHFYVSMKIMDKISHCCLIDSGSGPNVMSNIIMEELGLSCTNENSKNMLAYNNKNNLPLVKLRM